MFTILATCFSCFVLIILITLASIDYINGCKLDIKYWSMAIPFSILVAIGLSYITIFLSAIIIYIRYYLGV